MLLKLTHTFANAVATAAIQLAADRKALAGQVEITEAVSRLCSQSCNATSRVVAHVTVGARTLPNFAVAQQMSDHVKISEPKVRLKRAFVSRSAVE